MEWMARRAGRAAIGTLLALAGAGLCRDSSAAGVKSVVSWDAKGAAAYLDRREDWWVHWPGASRDRQTFCVSCHTALPYALARPLLRKALGESAPSPNERRLLEDVATRVRLWKEVRPYYGLGNGPRKPAESRGTESVLNALILASSDARAGGLSAEGRSAFDHMWELQRKGGEAKGSWDWLDFGNLPFEATDSNYYGACLAALATGLAPENYRGTPTIQPNLQLLQQYLAGQRVRQSDINQATLLWASTIWPGLLALREQQAIADALAARQRPDGGWSLAPLAWTWRASSFRKLFELWFLSNNSPAAPKTDGYATALIVIALRQADPGRYHAAVDRGLAWLSTHQNRGDGSWPGYSLTNRRDPRSPTGLFMSDAATAYAVLALAAAQ